jgi:hypothetical protein
MATPARFPEQNHTLRAPLSAPEVEPLPVWIGSGQIVSCWRLSWRERFSALLGGRIWLAVLSERSMPPVAVRVSWTNFEKRAR